MTGVIDWMLKASMLLTLGIAGAALARRRSAAFRHAILAAATMAALVLPALFLVSPGWEVRVPAPADSTVGVPAATTVGPVATRWSEVRWPDIAPVMPVAVAPQTVAQAVFWIWTAGAALLLLVLAVGLVRLNGWERGSTAPADARLETMMQELATALGLRRSVRLRFSPRHHVPMTWGHRAPCVLLPASADGWDAERLRVVLLHELAHIARADWAMHLMSDALRALFWFNPLAWLASRRLRHESECACDDRVLQSGISGPDYASHLLELARACEGKRNQWLPAPAIVETTSLERRVRAMLNPEADRAPVGKRTRFAVLMTAAAIAISVAGGTAAQNFATFAGSVVDPMNGVLPAVKFTLTNLQSGAKHEIRSDRYGRFELQGLEPGEYTIEASLPGFSTLTTRVNLVQGQRLEPNLQLQVGTLEETVGVADEGTAAANAAAPQVRSSQGRAIPPCPAPRASAEPRMGGNIRAPLKIRTVNPMYPPTLTASGKSGVVQLEGQIASDGRIEELLTVGTPDPDFEAAAIAAVREWQYDATLLNCVAIPVRLQVHVMFSGK